ncbi:hypothetical protein D3C71_1584760 [compost metagenome]
MPGAAAAIPLPAKESPLPTALPARPTTPLATEITSQVVSNVVTAQLSRPCKPPRFGAVLPATNAPAASETRVVTNNQIPVPVPKPLRGLPSCNGSTAEAPMAVPSTLSIR